MSPRKAGFRAHARAARLTGRRSTSKSATRDDEPIPNEATLAVFSARPMYSSLLMRSLAQRLHPKRSAIFTMPIPGSALIILILSTCGFVPAATADFIQVYPVPNPAWMQGYPYVYDVHVEPADGSGSPVQSTVTPLNHLTVQLPKHFKRVKLCRGPPFLSMVQCLPMASK